MAGDNAAPAKGGKSVLKEVPKWAWIAGGAAVVVIIILRLRSSSSAATTAVATPVSPPTVDPASIPATTGSGSTDSSVSTIVSVPPDYTSELSGMEASLAAIQTLLQQQTLTQPFHNTIHPIPVTPGSPNPPSYPGGTGDYAGGSNPAYVGPLPGSPAFGYAPDAWNPLRIDPVPLPPSLSFQRPPEPVQVSSVNPIGHSIPPSQPGYPATPLHAGIGATPRMPVIPEAPQNRIAVRS